MGMTRCGKSPLRFLFLFLSFLGMLYTIYGISLDYTIKEYFIRYFCKPVVSDYQTSIVLIGHMTFMIGNWIQTAGFTLGCMGAYCFLLEPEGRNKRTAKWSFFYSGVGTFFAVAGLGVWLYETPILELGWEWTAEYVIPYLLALIEFLIPVMWLVVCGKRKHHERNHYKENKNA